MIGRKVIGRKCIVAVDDSSIVLKTLAKLLGETYEFHAFTKGMRALKYLKEEDVPDLIILDIEMEEIDGYEMLDMIRKKEELKQVPVIFLTSNNDRQHVMKAISGGANDYAVKPVDEESFMDKVRKLLQEEKKKLDWDDV